jgi:hypothetical protein
MSWLRQYGMYFTITITTNDKGVRHFSSIHYGKNGINSISTHEDLSGAHRFDVPQQCYKTLKDVKTILPHAKVNWWIRRETDPHKQCEY